MSAPGRLDQRITLERATRAVGNDGSRDLLWSPLPVDPNPWARVILKGGVETDTPSGISARQAATFTLRNRSDLRTSDRIVWAGWVWNIASIDLPSIRGGYRTLHATAGELSA